MWRRLGGGWRGLCCREEPGEPLECQSIEVPRSHSRRGFLPFYRQQRAAATFSNLLSSSSNEKERKKSTD